MRPRTYTAMFCHITCQRQRLASELRARMALYRASVTPLGCRETPPLKIDKTGRNAVVGAVVATVGSPLLSQTGS